MAAIWSGLYVYLKEGIRGVPLVRTPRITSAFPPAVSLLSSGPYIPAINVGLVWQMPHDVSYNRQPSFCWSLRTTSAADAACGAAARTKRANQTRYCISQTPKRRFVIMDQDQLRLIVILGKVGIMAHEDTSVARCDGSAVRWYRQPCAEHAAGLSKPSRPHHRSLRAWRGHGRDGAPVGAKAFGRSRQGFLCR